MTTEKKAGKPDPVKVAADEQKQPPVTGAAEVKTDETKPDDEKPDATATGDEAGEAALQATPAADPTPNPTDEAQDDSGQGDKSPPAPPPADDKDGANSAAAAAQGSDDWQDKMLGHVSARGRDLPVGDVLAALGDDGRERVAAMQNMPAISRLAQRMQDTGYRGAPVVFTGDATGEAVTFFARYETVAAAIMAGVEKIPVLLIASEDVGEAQTVIVREDREANRKA